MKNKQNNKSLIVWNLFFFFSIIHLLITPTFLKSETYWNMADGPYIGDIRIIRVGDDNTIYTGTANGGLYYSKNGGQSWQQLYESLVGQKLINGIVIAGNVVIASTGSSGLFRSTDNGNSWNYHPPFDVNISFYTFTKDKQNNIYAGTSNGVYISSDRGLNWIQSSTGLPIGSIFSLFYTSKGDLFAGIFPLKGIYKSSDNGKSWFQSNEGLSNSNVYEFDEHPDGSIFVGTSNGIYKSTNNGASWFRINTGFMGAIVFSIVISNDGRAIAGSSDDGIYLSTDGGQNWFRSSIGNEVENLSVYSIDKSQSGHLYAGTSEGVFKSTNNGLTWEPSNNRLNAFNVRALFSKRNANILAGTNQYGIFKTTDNGISWYKVNNGLQSHNINTFLMDKDNNILVGTGSGVYRSTNDGESWTPINDGMIAGAVFGLAMAQNGDLFATVWSWGIYRSTNNGISWFSSHSGIPDASISMHCIFVASDGSIYAGSNNGGLFRSTNNGNTWNKTQGVQSNTIYSIYQTKDGTLLVGSKSEGLWRSSDGGNNWKNLINDFGENPPMIKSIITGVDDEILIGTIGKGIFRSTNDGQNCDEYNDGLMNLNVESLLLTENNSIFIGTNGSGLWGHIIPVSVADFPIANLRFDIYPMPISDEATILLNSPIDGRIKINIFDASGRNLGKLYEGFISAGDNFIKLNLMNLSNGIYFLDINYGISNLSRKIIISR